MSRAKRPTQANDGVSSGRIARLSGRTVATAAAIALAATPAVALAGSFSGATVPKQIAHVNKADTSTAVKVSCPKGTSKSCAGTVSLKTSKPPKGSKTNQTIGTGRFNVKPGKSAKVTVKLTREGKKIAKSGKITPIATAASHDGSGHRATKSSKITLESYGYSNGGGGGSCGACY